MTLQTSSPPRAAVAPINAPRAGFTRWFSAPTAGSHFGPRSAPRATHFAYHSLHFSGIERTLHDHGLCWFVPLLYHEVPRYYREDLSVDVAMLPAAPMDEHGYFNFSLSNSFSKAICDKAKTVILEVNPSLPVCLGGRDESVHISEVDRIVEAEWKNPELPVATPTEVDERIAGLIMGEIEDGS